MRLKKIFLLAIAAVSVFLGGCRTVVEEITPDERKTVSLSRLETDLAGPDPIEPFNRTMFAVTDFCMNYIADPIGRVYCTILPRPVIECIDNACVNLEFPARAVSCLLRAEWGGALDETIRFLFNTVVGIGGLFDPAQYWLHIYSTDSKFGEAFAVWGIGPGCRFILPFSSAANVRDTVGMLFDTVFDCKTYIPYCGWATGLNRVVVAQDKYSSALSGSRDPYKGFIGYALLSGMMGEQLWGYRYRNALRDASRKWQIDEASGKMIPPPLEPELPVPIPAWAAGRNRWVDISGYYGTNPVTDSLRSVFFKEQKRNSFWYMPLSLFCSDFVCGRNIYKIKEDERVMRYAFWNAAKTEDGAPETPERLVFILPGIGGTYMDSSPTALAELFYLRNAKVAVINSTFSWQFNESRKPGELPGYLPDDAEVLRRTIKRVLQDLKEREKIKSPEIVLVGYSFGAMHTLKIADLESKDKQLDIARYIAINPPVSLDNAMTVADKLVSCGAGIPIEELKDKFIDAAGRIMAASNMQLAPYSPEKSNARLYRINIPERESSVIVGLNLRNSMRELLFSAHLQKPLSGIKNDADKVRKNNLYLELDRVTFRRYAENILAPRYGDMPLNRLYQMSDLRSISGTLKCCEKITVFHNCDDFLLTDSDRKFLSDTLGKRLVWFSRGGHLGNLYDSRVQKLISDTALPETGPDKEFEQKKRILQPRINKSHPLK